MPTGGTFTGVGAADNNVGTEFVATGTTPTWGTGAVQRYTAPFKVTGGNVYIDKAVITEVTAGSILAGTINVSIELTAATITAGTINGGTINAAVINATDINGGTMDAADITGGTIEIGSGTSRFRVGPNGVGAPGTQFGLDSGTNPNIFISDNSGVPAILFQLGTTTVASIVITSLGQLAISGNLSASSEINSFEVISSQILRAFSSADPGTSSAPLKSEGGCWIEKSIDVRGNARLNANLAVAGTVNVAGGTAGAPGYAITVTNCASTP